MHELALVDNVEGTGTNSSIKSVATVMLHHGRGKLNWAITHSVIPIEMQPWPARRRSPIRNPKRRE
jgi:hypothetical protein